MFLSSPLTTPGQRWFLPVANQTAADNLDTGNTMVLQMITITDATLTVAVNCYNSERTLTGKKADLILLSSLPHLYQ